MGPKEHPTPLSRIGLKINVPTLTPIEKLI